VLTFNSLKEFFKSQNFRMIIAADGETRIAQKLNGEVIQKAPAGGVSIALDPIARASSAIYIARAKDPKEKEIGGAHSIIQDQESKYTLKRLFFSEDDIDCYYYGFSNQTLWPLCHVAFQKPEFHKNWFEGFKKVNKKFAQSIKEEIKGKTFIWINDYQLSLVPKYLDNPRNTIVAMFWHIPWPTWEVFRILPYKKEILESILRCDFVAFHRGYQARNFIETVRREFETRIDDETAKVYLDNTVTTIKNLPMGVDTDVIRSLVDKDDGTSLVLRDVEKVIGSAEKVILGVDRLDYTKGLINRLMAIDRFFERNPKYIGIVVYIGIMAPSREAIPSYRNLKEEIKKLSQTINKKYKNNTWQPIHLISAIYPRKEIINFYQKADVCLVTPLDDGMNLVSKEFVVASSFSENPGMLVLSQFAGSAIDLTDALIVNPYSLDEVISAIKKALEMDPKEKQKRIKRMVEVLDDKNVYEWAEEFVKNAVGASKKP